MGRQLQKLVAVQVNSLPPGRHADGGGLYLDKDGHGRSRWLFMWKRNGRRREMGLGPAGKGGVPLARARGKAQQAREDLDQGLDPIEARDRREASPVKVPTFGEAADAYLKSLSGQWRNDKHRAQWTMTLKDYAAKLRPLPVDKVDTATVLECLTPLWQSRPETASRLRGRIERILDAARAQGHRSGENPARWRGHLDHLLPARQRLTRGHHAAMSYEDVPTFMAALRGREAVAALALEFVILTAARTGEAIGAKWAEIDLNANVWCVPAARMKAGREHRVPLTAKAVDVLRKAEILIPPGTQHAGAMHIFPGPRSGGLSNMAMAALLKRMKVTATVHGFRSSFRDWAGEASSFPRELAEAALAHTVGDATERAYRRGDALEKRRKLMDAWAGFCDSPRRSGMLLDFGRAKRRGASRTGA